jgi:hypothetical protein
MIQSPQVKLGRGWRRGLELNQPSKARTPFPLPLGFRADLR